MTITVRDLAAGQGQIERPLRIDSLVVDLRDVAVSRDFSSVLATSSTTEAHASYAALSTTRGARVPALSSGLGRIVSTAIPLDGLPFGVRVDGLDVNPDGLVLHLSGTNLT